MNILMCSVGRRAELLKNFKNSMNEKGKIIATDLSPFAPALYFADQKYLVPKIDDPAYIDILLDICAKESIDTVTTFIDPEIEILAANRARFEQSDIEVLAPYTDTAKLCFNKYLMFQYLCEHGIPTVPTWGTLEEFDAAYKNGIINFPVFVKPRTGSGSVGINKISSYEMLAEAMYKNPELIIQEFMEGIDVDVDVYIDTVTHEAVSAFSKRKIESRIGGASKTVSFKDEKLFRFVSNVVKHFQFNGPVDMDLFYKDNQYFLSEINPRFGGAYLHAYGAGIDFVKLIENNLNHRANEPTFGDYEEGVAMMMYDSVVIKKEEELV